MEHLPPPSTRRHAGSRGTQSTVHRRDHRHVAAAPRRRGAGRECTHHTHKDKGVDVGYFDHAHLDNLARCGDELSASGAYKGVYVTLNPLDPALLDSAANQLVPQGTARRQPGRKVPPLAADRRRYAAQCRRAGHGRREGRGQRRALEIGKCLREHGWPIPALADSGNGYHVLVP